MNLPKVWNAPTTTNSDRQRIVRLLVDVSWSSSRERTEQVEATLHWTGGFISQHSLIRPVRRYEQTADYERLVSRIKELYEQGKSYAEIAEHLNSEDSVRPSRSSSFKSQSSVGSSIELRRDRPLPEDVEHNSACSK